MRPPSTAKWENW